MNSYIECKAIVDLDLDPIKVKLMHEESGEGWTLEQANAVEFEYRRFLYLMKIFPNEQTAPLADVDTFWHYHILDTMKYAADCAKIFGYFLHHFPYIGLRGKADEETHQRLAERMGELYEQTFGEPYGRRPGIQRAPDAAFSRRTKQAGFLGSTVKTAFSGATTKPALSNRIVNTAFSGTPGNVAFSGSPGAIAFSGSTTVTAFSDMPVPPSRQTVVKQAQPAFAATEALLDFYTRRPVLAIA